MALNRQRRLRSILQPNRVHSSKRGGNGSYAISPLTKWGTRR
jgi:hypothetical protein